MLGKLIGRTLLILGLVSFSLPLYAGTSNHQLSIDKGSKLWLDGTSTLHKWECTTSTVNLNTGMFTMSSPTVGNVKALFEQLAGNFVITIPVKSFKDPEPGFNHALYRDLHYKQHPNITFSMSSVTVTKDPSTPDRYTVSAQGDITVSGHQNPESISAVVDVDNNTLKITGTKDLHMTDFGIKPPTMFFGTVKTGDEVTVRWDLSLSPR